MIKNNIEININIFKQINYLKNLKSNNLIK
jgi:hypothetical protein